MWIWLLPIGIAALTIILRESVAALVFRLYARPVRLRIGETPAAFALRYDELSFVSDGVRHAAWLIHPPESPADAPLPAVLMPHGFAANRSDILPRCAAVARAGMRVFTFDWRGHGESEGTLCSGGLIEKEDLKAALTFLRRLDGVDAGRIALYGFSMGATVALLVAAEDEAVSCVVADSPYRGLGEILEHVIGQLKLPRALLRGPIRRRFRRTFGHDFTSVDIPAAVRRIPPERLLLLGGTADRVVPFEHVNHLYESSNAETQFHVTEGGSHFDNADPAILSGTVIPFLRKHLALDE